MTGPETRSLLDAARELAPKIRAAADEIEAERELPRAALRGARRRRASTTWRSRARSAAPSSTCRPTSRSSRSWARPTRAPAWTVNQGAIYATYSARMPHDVARAIWIDTPRAVVANTPAPTATAIVVPGGFRVTGRQGFSTGCRHASWIAPHVHVIENGQVRLDADGQPEARYVYVPVGEVELLDTWHVRGMRGTGTHHFAVNDVFVPAERSVLSATAPLVRDGPALPDPAHALLRLGRCLGGARRRPAPCLEAFFELAGAKTARANTGVLREQPMVQADVGHAEANLRSGRAFLPRRSGTSGRARAPPARSPSISARRFASPRRTRSGSPCRSSTPSTMPPAPPRPTRATSSSATSRTST